MCSSSLKWVPSQSLVNIDSTTNRVMHAHGIPATNTTIGRMWVAIIFTYRNMLYFCNGQIHQHQER